MYLKGPTSAVVVAQTHFGAKHAGATELGCFPEKLAAWCPSERVGDPPPKVPEQPKQSLDLAAINSLQTLHGLMRELLLAGWSHEQIVKALEASKLNGH